MATKKTAKSARRPEHSPPLSDEEIQDINDFHNHPENRKTGTLSELLAELHGANREAS